MAKITDVAREAGVAPSTVSHVLNGKRRISEATKHRVLAAIERLGYMPNHNAQALKTDKTGIIGFFASDITELFTALIIRGVERALREQNYHLLFASGAEFEHGLDEALKLLKRRRLDGLIVSYETAGFEPAVPPDMESDIPMVFINRPGPESAYTVLADDYRGGREAARHLIGVGAYRPAVISGPKDRAAAYRRLEGFLDELSAQGVDLPEEYVFEGNFDYEAGEHGLAYFAQLDPSIDGIFCGNDYMAAGCINAARSLDWRIPEDLKVLGYDNRDFSAFWSIPISTYEQPLDVMGQKSVSILLDAIEGKGSADAQTLIPSRFLPRRSTGAG
jgi:LacI family transcriptional regulator